MQHIQLMHFKPHEFTCKCGKCGLGVDSMDERLLVMLDAIRKDMGVSMRINSAVRCAEHNRAVGGSAKSEHVPENTDTGKCTAVDIHLSGSMFLYELVEELYEHGVPRIGLNQESNFIHVGLSKAHPQRVFFKY